VRLTAFRPAARGNAQPGCLRDPHPATFVTVTDQVAVWGIWGTSASARATFTSRMAAKNCVFCLSPRSLWRRPSRLKRDFGGASGGAGGPDPELEAHVAGVGQQVSGRRSG